MIYFNRPALVGNELKYIQDAVAQGMLCGDGKYTKLCSAWMKERFQVNQVFLTTSCTHALEMAAFLSDIQPGDEVIMPSYTFVSTADAFVLRGAKIVFVDIRPDTMNIDENLIEDAITEKTRAIVPVHYAGVGCEMNKIMEIARRHNLKVVEDAAHLYAQLEECDKINRKRHQVYDGYHERLEDLEKQGKIQRPVVPEGCVHNAHMYYIKVKDIAVRTRLIAYLRENGIAPAFHYVPLHSSPAGEKFGRFHGKDVYTTKESERLLRLPMFYDLSMDDVDYIAEKIREFEF